MLYVYDELCSVVVSGGSFCLYGSTYFSSPGPYEVERWPSGSLRQMINSCRGVHITTRSVACPDWVAVRVAPHYTARIISMSRRKPCLVCDGLQHPACGADRFRSGADRTTYIRAICVVQSRHPETVPGGVLNKC